MKLKVNISDVDEIYTSLIWKEEIVKALKKRKNGKLCGVDGTTADVLKADTKTHYLETFFNYLKPENIPAASNKGLIVIIPPPPPKKKWYLYLRW